MQTNADALDDPLTQDLRAELGSKYGPVCIPFIGMFFAIGIRGKVKEFEPEFRSENQLAKDLGNETITKNKKGRFNKMKKNLFFT